MDDMQTTSGIRCDACDSEGVTQTTRAGDIIVCPLCKSTKDPNFQKVLSWGNTDFRNTPKTYKPYPRSTKTKAPPTTQNQPQQKPDPNTQIIIDKLQEILDFIANISEKQQQERRFNNKFS